MKKLAHYPRLIFLGIFLLIYVISYYAGLENPLFRTVSAVALAFVLSPRRKKIQTQTGDKTQVNWLLLKDPLFID